jgi:hypothetical protein
MKEEIELRWIWAAATSDGEWMKIGILRMTFIGVFMDFGLLGLGRQVCFGCKRRRICFWGTFWVLDQIFVLVQATAFFQLGFVNRS